jgi:MOSC domain-containing protein
MDNRVPPCYERGMPIVGRVRELWRYPVKSMGGEKLERCRLGTQGVLGDRGWALRDEQAGEIRGAKKMPALLTCQARYLGEPTDDHVPAAEITLPDGSRLRSDAPTVAARLSELTQRRVTLWPRQPASATEHYRRAAPDNPDLLAELRAIFGRLEEEPLPDLSVFPPEIMQYTSPLGTYFDAFPMHLLTTASLAKLGAYAPDARFDVRRFRPNILVDAAGGAPEFVENDWCGRTLHIGEAALKIEIPCVRCVMTTLPQGELPKDPTVLRTIVREGAQNLGVYATVVTAGTVAVGDGLLLS